MDFGFIKAEIIRSIEEINDFDFDKLSNVGPGWVAWNEMSAAQIKIFVDYTLSVIKKIPQQIDVLDSLGFPQCRGVYKQLKNLNDSIVFFSSELALKKTITNQHHAILDHINSLNHFVRSSGLIFELNVYPSYEEIKTIIIDTKEAKEKVIKDSTEVSRMRTEAETSLAGKVNADLVRYLLEQKKTYRNFSYGALFFLISLLVTGFIFLVHPIWESLTLFVIGENDKSLLFRYMMRLPYVVLYISLLFILASFYKRYEMLALSMEHKASVINSLPQYTNQLLSEVTKMDIEQQSKAKNSIINFEIKTLEKVFEQPVLSEKMMKIQAGINEKGGNFSIGDE